ncbi:serine/threonine protein kinase [Paraliomyxa miuraensis]|nr:serine/threonine protein kinase [Paraliomyxa miuraensis]
MCRRAPGQPREADPWAATDTPSGSGARVDGRLFEVPRLGTVVREIWELRSVLGKGTFGVVYGAWHRGLRREDAIKVLHPHLADDDELRERFRQEAIVMARLRGEHLVRVYDCGEHAGLPFLVMEYLNGETLHDRLRVAGPLEFGSFRRVAMGLTRGLTEVHGFGILHRDIKPANIFVQRGSDEVKLLDFGLAKGSLRLTARGTTLGTPLYMAPELLVSTGATASESTDVYSTGVVLYQMLTGRLPFQLHHEEGLDTLVRRILAGIFPSPRALRGEISPGLDRIVTCTLARDPKQRPATARALLDALEACWRAPVSRSARPAYDVHPPDSPPRVEAEHRARQEGAAHPLFELVWNRLDADLQDAFMLAATAALRGGKDYISTTTLFAAIRRLSPEPMPRLFEQLPPAAVEDSIPTSLDTDAGALGGIRSFSPCVDTALEQLSPLATSEHRITTEDLFLDIARYGTGKSTMRLRTHGVSRDRIDEIIRQLGWVILERA